MTQNDEMRRRKKKKKKKKSESLAAIAFAGCRYTFANHPSQA